jgi:membrane-associated protease RseP (regulator of RpoE activity)
MILGLYAAAAFLAMLVMFAVYALVTAALMRRAGLPVEKVMVGFGPAWWRREIGGTWYSLRWIPLGASVKCPLDEGDTPAEQDVGANDSGSARGHAPAAPPPGGARYFDNLPLRQQLLITVGGHVVVTLIGMLLLAVAVLAGEPQLAACDAAQSAVQLCGMPGLRWREDATTSAGQVLLLRETGLEFVLRMLFFRPLEGWGGLLSALVTAGAVGQHSLVSWVTLIGLLWTMTGLVNLLPVPSLSGFQVVQFTAEAWFGRRRLEYVVTPLLFLGLLCLITVLGRLLWLDVQWIRAQWF